MGDQFKQLYDSIADRKGEAQALGPYSGGNGRVDRAAALIVTDDDFRKGPDRYLLDVGGATGNLGYLLRDHFEERFVLEIAEACRVPAESKGNRFTMALEDGSMPYPDGMFDVVTALDFIEHILDPELFARECFRVLKPGGMVLINTPNIQFWRHLHSLVVDGVFPHTSGDRDVYHGGHVAFYNMNDLAVVFGNAGFVTGRMVTDGLTADPPPPIWLHLAKCPPRWLSYADLVYACRKPV